MYKRQALGEDDPLVLAGIGQRVVDQVIDHLLGLYLVGDHPGLAFRLKKNVVAVLLLSLIHILCAALSESGVTVYATHGCTAEEYHDYLCRALKMCIRDRGLGALDYTEENRRLFNALPSKSETRTLSHDIVSLEDRRLLRRGTAAVRTDAA